MFVSTPTPKFICCDLIPSEMALGGKASGHEGETLGKGISTLVGQQSNPLRTGKRALTERELDGPVPSL